MARQCFTKHFQGGSWALKLSYGGHLEFQNDRH